ncbi:MAG: helicase [Microbacterium sp.]|jgi:secretion/DNA translocation related TadE-like protein|uniref:Rv3654c family TadE-like protein n=1 Tax=Microbacterium sp. TaxID=51671 RepID=UPI000DAFB93E|nr:Rv3654c family TadE-like protein [Microbacterium sp.]PZU38800.1 MAG: helicase [Microbacterium sp.]
MAGAVLAVGAVLTASTLAVGLAVVGQASVVSQRAAGAADNAAVAAADALSGAATGQPCARAAEVAATFGLEVAACTISGADVTVTVTGGLLGLPVTARARAGPPQASQDVPGRAGADTQ